MKLTERTKRSLCLLLSLLMLLSCIAVFASCGETSDDPAATTAPDSSHDSESESAETDTRFDGVAYDGREFRIYTSTNAASIMGTSNVFIEGIGEMGGGMVSDAVFERNVRVEELLDVQLVFTQVDLRYDFVAADIRKYTTSGLDEFDLMINDIYSFSELLIEGNFRNILEDECVFDFDRPYWYKDFMEDLRLMDGYQYVMAGDYFIDVLRTAHLLLLNKELYNEIYRSSADEVYDMVTNYEWTYEKLIAMISDLYVDKNLDGVKNQGDRFGYVDWAFWGATIPLAGSGTTNYISRDEDGIPTVVIHEGDRANQLGNAISALLNNDSTYLMDDNGPLNSFVEGNTLIAATASLGTLESQTLRQMEGDLAVLPYPMLFASDKKYTTSVHDTTEMGVIPVTAKDLAFISTVTEVLNRETARIVLPKYYNESLQVQYVDDEKAAAMIDIIHDNFDNSFILAYNGPLGNCILQSFCAAAENKREFSAVYAAHQKSVQRTLESKIKLFMKKNNIK